MPTISAQTLEEQIDRYMYEIVDNTHETLGEIGVPEDEQECHVIHPFGLWLLERRSC